MRRPTFGLATIFAISLVAIITAVVAVMSVLQVQRERGNIRDASETAAVSLTETLGSFFADTMSASGDLLIPTSIEFLAGQPQILRIRIIDPQGQIIATAGDEAYFADGTTVINRIDSAEPIVNTRGDTSEVYRTIRSGDRTFGVIQFAIMLGSKNDLSEAIREILIQAAIFIFAGIVLAIVLARYITAPLRSLVTATNRISEGDLGFSTATSRRDEVGVLANALDDMRSGLQAARTEVQLANRELESEVEHRIEAESAVKSRAEVNQVLAEIGKLMTTTLEIEDVYERFAELTSRLLPFDRIAVAAVDIEAETLTTTYESGVHIPSWGPGQTRPLFKPLGAMVLESPSAILMDQELAEWVVTEYPEMQDILDEGLVSTLAVPIFARDQPIAFMALNSRDPEAYTADDAELAEQIVAQIAGVIANVDLRAELQREVEVRATQAEIGRLVSSSIELDQMYRTLATLVRGLIPYDRFVISRVEMAAESVTTEFVEGVDVPGRRVGVSNPLKATAIDEAINDRKTVHLTAEPEVEREYEDPLGPNVEQGLLSLVITPLYSQGSVIGAISLSARRHDAYSTEDIDLLERIAAQVGGAIGVAQLNARIQAESEQQVQRLEDLDQLRVQFLQMVTHEFRTPLASLRVSRDLLAESAIEELDRSAYSRLITNMGRGVDRLDTLVTDLLDLTIAQAGELNLSLTAVNIEDLLDDSIEIVAPLASQRDQKFILDVESPVPVLQLDRDRIEQVLLNLLSNAQKYSNDKADIDVTAKRVEGFAEIRVTGRGPDIPEQDRPHMFEPFFRGTGASTKTTPGRGLGLSIAKAFVELHGGIIAFDSLPGKGPSFYFRLPLDR